MEARNLCVTTSAGQLRHFERTGFHGVPREFGSYLGMGIALGQDWHKRVEHKMAALAGKVTSN